MAAVCEFTKRHILPLIISLCIIICFCVIPMGEAYQVHAEALTITATAIGAIIIAVMTASGIALTVDGYSGSDIATYIYNEFVTYLETVNKTIEQVFTVGSILMYSTWCKLTNSISTIISNFATWYKTEKAVNTLTLVNTTTAYKMVVDGVDIIQNWDNSYKTTLPPSSAFYFEYDKTYNINGRDTIFKRYTRTVNGFRYAYIKYNVDSEYYQEMNNNSTEIISEYNGITDYNDRIYPFIFSGQYPYYFTSYNYSSGYEFSIRVNYVDELPTQLHNPVSLTQTLRASCDELNTPLESITENDYTYVSITGSTATTIDDFTNNVLTDVGTNTLTSTYTNAASDEALEAEQPENPPSVSDYSLSELGLLLTTKFPFSIPWDVEYALDMLEASAVLPQFELTFPLSKIDDNAVDIIIQVDLSGGGRFTIIWTILRWGILVLFCVGLIVETKRLIWTA